MSTSKYKPAACGSLVLKRVLRLPSRAWAGASALLEGALVLAAQLVRLRAVPLCAAVQTGGATVVLVVDDVVVDEVVVVG